MAYSTYDAFVVVDPRTLAPIAGVAGIITDATTGNPVQVYDMNGKHLNVIATNIRGYVGGFKTNDWVTRIEAKFGEYTLVKTSAETITEAAALGGRVASVEVKEVEQDSRLDSLGSMAGIGPGDTSDGTVSGLVLNQATITRTNMDALYAPRFVERDIKRDFGAVGDGVTDDTAAFAAAMSPALGAAPDAMLADRTGEFIRLHIPFGTYRVDPNTITWDLYRCVLDSQNAVFLVENTTATDWAMRVTSTAPRLNGTSFYNQMNRNGSFALRSAAGRVGIGMLLEGATAPDSLVASGHRLTAQTALEKVVISGFHKGVMYGENAYMIGFRDTAFNDCNHWAHFPPSANAGERLWFDGCTFGNQVSGFYNDPADVYTNGYPGLWMEGDQSFVFNNCSFDWAAFLFDVAANSEVYFIQPHFETPHGAMPRQADIDAGHYYGRIREHALVSIKQGRFLYGSGNVAPDPIPFLVHVNAWGTLEVDAATIYATSPHLVSWVQPGATPPVLRAVTTFQAAPAKTSPLPALSAKGTISPASWNFATRDADWTWSGGAGSGDLITTPVPAGSTGAMKIVGTNTWMRLTKPVRGPVRHVGLSVKVIALTAGATQATIIYRIKDAAGAQLHFYSAPQAINTSTYSHLWFAFPTYRSTTGNLRAAASIEWEIVINGGEAAISQVVADYWE